MLSSCIFAAGLGMFLPAGAGCLVPTIVSKDAGRVVIEYGPWDTPLEVHRLAASLCRDHGKAARRLTDTPAEDDSRFRIVTFACVEKDSV